MKQPRLSLLGRFTDGEGRRFKRYVYNHDKVYVVDVCVREGKKAPLKQGSDFIRSEILRQIESGKAKFYGDFRKEKLREENLDWGYRKCR